VSFVSAKWDITVSFIKKFIIVSIILQILAVLVGGAIGCPMGGACGDYGVTIPRFDKILILSSDCLTKN